MPRISWLRRLCCAPDGTPWILACLQALWCLAFICCADLGEERQRAVHRRRERIGFPLEPHRSLLLDRVREKLFVVAWTVYKILAMPLVCCALCVLAPCARLVGRSWVEPGAAGRGPDYGRLARKKKGVNGRRRRALTLPLEQPDRVRFVRFRVRQRTDAQAGSALFAMLPREVRLEIWRYVVGGVDCHFYQLVEKKARKRRDVVVYVDKDCVLPAVSPGEEGTPFENSRAAPYSSGGDGELFAETPASCELLEAPRTKRGLLSLALTCRMAYSESIPIIYQHNTFIFDMYSLTRFFSMRRTIPTHRFDLIRSLRLSWSFSESFAPRWDRELGWPDVCQTLATMPHLRELEILVMTPSLWRFNGELDGRTAGRFVMIVLKPLVVVRQVSSRERGGSGVFDVLVPWPKRSLERELEDGDGNVGPSLPFRLVRYNQRSALGKELLKRDYVLHPKDPIVGGGQTASEFRDFWVTRNSEDWMVETYDIYGNRTMHT